jgi:transcriptional regulator with XRE-family HTH domain
MVRWHEGDVIRKLRQAVGWTLGDLHRVSGVDMGVIHRLEIGRTKEPKRGTLVRIAAAFGLTDRQLLDAVPAQIELPIRLREEGRTARKTRSN